MDNHRTADYTEKWGELSFVMNRVTRKKLFSSREHHDRANPSDKKTSVISVCFVNNHRTADYTEKWGELGFVMNRVTRKKNVFVKRTSRPPKPVR